MARTLFQRADQADSDCTPASAANKPLLSTETNGGETVTVSIPAQTMGAHVFAFTMAVGDPGGEDLGAGSLFEADLDVTVADTPITYTVRFVALDSSCNILTAGSIDMDETDFSGIGVKEANATWDPPALADRYGIQIRGTNSNGHNGAAGTLTIRTNVAAAIFRIPDAPGAVTQPHFEYRVPEFA